MKKHILALLLSFIAFQSFSQTKELNPNIGGKIFHSLLNGADKPKGSPYFSNAFMSAKVDNVAGKTMMRYNVYNDEFEFITPKNDTLVLDKIADFGNITTINGKNYNLVAYTNRQGKLTNGYLINFYQKGDLILYKKENVTFYEARPAKTSLETSLPAKFVKADDTFYLKTKENAIVEFPESKKQLVKLNPAKKAEIETFLKENKISFTEDSDRIKIVDFLAAL